MRRNDLAVAQSHQMCTSKRSCAASAAPGDATIATKRYINRPRLKGFDYRGDHAFHVTIVTRGREPLLVSEVATNVASAVNEAAGRTGVTVLAFCVMPDRIHALVRCETREASLTRFVQRFKQLTSYAHIARTGERLWQPSFHDHALRRDEDAPTIAKYSFDNPVAAELINQAASWPHSGGVLFDEAFAGRS
jgi:REP element-mobilizing transposase RayT